MSTAGADRVVQVARLGLMAGGALFATVYLVVALGHLAYPFELEWLEGGVLEHVRRVREGQALYVPPSLEFVPLLYPPLYYYLAAGLSEILGAGFLPLRVLSFTASLGCFLLLYLLVRRETGDGFAAFLALALFAATYALAGAFLDLARIDSLFLCLTLAAAYAVRHGESAKAALLAGLLVCLAYLTKQSALLVALPLLLYSLLWKPRWGAWFAGTAVLTSAAATVVLDRLHGGWFRFYTFEMPRAHELLPEMYLGFWLQDLLRPLPIACVAAVACLLHLFRRGSRGAAAFYLLVTGGMLAAAWLSRLHTGGYANVLLPAYAALAILFGIGMHHFLRRVRAARGRARSLLELSACGVAALQFASLVYDPRALVPTRKDLETGRALVARIASMDGEIWIPGQGYLARLAGKPAHAHAALVHDVLRAGESPARDRLAAELAAALAERRFSALILNASFPRKCPPRPPEVTGINWFCQDVLEHYRRAGSLIEDPDAFWPVTGSRQRPEVLLLPREAAGPPPEAAR